MNGWLLSMAQLRVEWNEELPSFNSQTVTRLKKKSLKRFRGERKSLVFILNWPFNQPKYDSRYWFIFHILSDLKIYETIRSNVGSKMNFLNEWWLYILNFWSIFVLIILKFLNILKVYKVIKETLVLSGTVGNLFVFGRKESNEL